MTSQILSFINNPLTRAQSLGSQSDSHLDTSGQYRYQLSMSFMEVYNEKVRDLINSGLSLTVMEDLGQNTNIVGLKKREVSSLAEIQKILKEANSLRSVGTTKVNSASSRSHAIVVYYFQKFDLESKKVRISKLTFVDLAGSERLTHTEAAGLRLVEGSNINRSLLALGNVITKLSLPGKLLEFVPYRDSKLTRILKDSLGGNSHTYMITCISLAAKHYEETLHTLLYASRAKMITTSVAKNPYFSLDQKEIEPNSYKTELTALPAENKYQQQIFELKK